MTRQHRHRRYRDFLARLVRGRALWAVLLAVLAFASVMAAQRDQGIVRDEVVYMGHGDKYAAWWGKLFSGERALSEPVITEHFGGPKPTSNNREHPPLMKTLFGFSHKLFSQRLGWLDELSAYRLPSAAMNALLVALVFVFAAGLFGRAAGLIAALTTLLLPRAFFHAGLACFDAAMVTLWMATIMAYYRALSSRLWCLWLGVIFGLALATKHNALLLPGVMGAHYLYLAVRSQVDEWRAPGIKRKFLALWRGIGAVQPLIIPALAFVGPLVLIAVWPWLWFEPFAHLYDWVRFHLDHVHYNFEYLGENWNAAPYPWHVALVTTLFTVPVATILAAICGAGAHVRALIERTSAAPERAPVLLLSLSALVAVGPFLLGSAPIFGAEKHWAPAVPTLCILAGLGARAASELAVAHLCRLGVVRERYARAAGWVALGLVGAVVVGASASETLASRPYALSHYNALAGGAPGGADLGMNRQFWGYAARGALPYLNARAGESSGPIKVYTHDASPTWGWYKRLGLRAGNLDDAGHERGGVTASRFALVVHEKHFNRHDYLIWDVYGTVQPAYVLTFQGVPVVSVYRRP